MQSNRTTSRSLQLRPAMTLVEMMIVLTIMAAVMAFAAYNVIGMLRNARIKDARAETSQLRGLVDTFFVAHGRLPIELAELADEVDGVAPIMLQVPEDPWGNPYLYEPEPGGRFTLYSSGPDEQPGSEDDIALGTE